RLRRNGSDAPVGSVSGVGPPAGSRERVIPHRCRGSTGWSDGDRTSAAYHTRRAVSCLSHDRTAYPGEEGEARIVMIENAPLFALRPLSCGSLIKRRHAAVMRMCFPYRICGSGWRGPAVTTDDRMIRRAVQVKLDLRVRLVTPP